MKQIGLGLMGLGNIGIGTWKTLEMNGETIKKNTGIDFKFVKILEKNVDAKRDIDVDKKMFTDDPQDLFANDDIDIVIELLGGVEPATSFMLEALNNGKHVVTANKAAVAANYDKLLESAEKNNVMFRYEASVGGGIPIVTPLMESLVANTVTEIRGIMNGTSNYILTKMKEDNLSFDEALKIASEKGYAEADPTYDVDGIDAGHKINILASLAYGGSIKFKDMQLSGIREISTVDIFSANQLNSTIKLIASSKLLSDTSAQISVEPTLIPNSEILAKVDDVYNAIETTGSYTDKTLFYGKGAGMDPTASAVVADIVKIVTRNHIESDYFFNSTKVFEIVDSNTVKDSYYIRVSDDFDIENSPFELINQIENYYIILANNISKNEINEILKDAKEKLILRVMK